MNDQRLSRYARLIVTTGLNIQSDQRLIVSAPVETAPLVRLVAEEAYRAGCRLVHVLWDDDAVTLARFRHAPRDSFEEYPIWQAAGLEEEGERGSAFLAVLGFDPDLLAEQDPDLVSTALRIRQRHLKPVSELRRRNAMNWCVVAMPTEAWAARVFPQEARERRIEKLKDVLFSLCRLDADDPVAAWQKHIRALVSRRDFLNGRRYDLLRYRGPGTDLTIGLAENHRWVSAQVRSRAGIAFVANMPTEEVFTAPHRERIEGTVTASKPLFHRGMVFENFSFRFQDGRVVDVRADRGEDLLKKIVKTDEGSARLGEVALVPESSPVARSGLLFYNPLLDENAACHLALGSAFGETIEGGMGMEEQAFMGAGGNISQVHMDFMIGSPELSVEGVTQEGKTEPILTQGEWAFEEDRRE